MDVILHLGAHRTGTTSFQAYLRAHRDDLEARRIGFWGPWRTRKGLLHGLAERPDTPDTGVRAAGRVQLALAGARRDGIDHLVVTDENMAGTARKCLRAAALYPGIGERVARLTEGFGRVHRIVLQIRALDLWWASAIGYVVPRGEPLPAGDHLTRIAHTPRSWRHVITDLACACPQADIVITPFERFGDRPDVLLSVMTGARQLPGVRAGEFWKNRHADCDGLRDALAERGEDPARLPEGDGRWMPFEARDQSRLREAYADDLFWLRAGADGLARLYEDERGAQARTNHAAFLHERGQMDDGHTQQTARRLARDR